jgi:prepilin-type N-terminal cleavage/methylation domain-containing protein
VIAEYLTILIFLFIICLAGRSTRRINPTFRLLPGFQRNSCPKASSNTCGYTLIELIVVIVLLGLMFGLVVPKFRQAVLSDSLDATSLRLIGLIENLRERAISDQVSYVLHLDIRGKEVCD